MVYGKKSLRSKNNKLFIANIIFTLIVGIAVALISTTYANNLAASLEEKYNSPLRPTSENLDISMHPSFPELPIQYMVDENLLLNSRIIEICIINPAKMGTGSIQIDIFDENLTSSEEYPIENIDSIKRECSQISLRHKECNVKNCSVNMNLNSVTNGTRDFTFKFRCTNCKPDTFNKTFSMCLWRESDSECKK